MFAIKHLVPAHRPHVPGINKPSLQYHSIFKTINVCSTFKRTLLLYSIRLGPLRPLPHYLRPRENCHPDSNFMWTCSDRNAKITLDIPPSHCFTCVDRRCVFFSQRKNSTTDPYISVDGKFSEPRRVQQENSCGSCCYQECELHGAVSSCANVGAR